MPLRPRLEGSWDGRQGGRDDLARRETWKAMFLTVDNDRDEQLKFRVEGLAQFMREKIDLAPTPLISK